MYFSRFIFFFILATSFKCNDITRKTTPSSIQSMYLANTDILEIENIDTVDFTKLLMTNVIHETDFDKLKANFTPIELKVKDGKIIELIEYFDDGLPETHNENINLPINNWPIRKIFFLKKDKTGTSSVGGSKPLDFKLPNHAKLKSSFIYFATIDCTDPFFEWMHLDKLHIAYPIFEGCFQIFLDYKNPNAPIILNPEVFTYSFYEGNNLIGIENLEFNEQKYKCVDQLPNPYNEESFMDNYLMAGVPSWEQSPQIPISPKNGKIMRFVTSIRSDNNIKVKDKAIFKNRKFSMDYLNFGDYGTFYVFYEPDSKVVCLNYQF
jgi:hypothetical protein